MHTLIKLWQSCNKSLFWELVDVTTNSSCNDFTFYDNFKLKIKNSLTKYRTSHLGSRCMHFYGTCPSIICTHSTLDVTKMLGHIQTRNLCPNLTLMHSLVWAKPIKPC